MSHRARAELVRGLVAEPDEQTLEDVADRVAHAVVQVERRSERAHWQAAYAEWISARAFLPNLPTLSNAGRGGQLAACFVLEPTDSLKSIYSTLSRAALIQQGAGGTGIHFSELRPRGAPIERSGGSSPGPVGFLELFAHSARVNSRAGRRPGAHLAILRADHPDVVEFIRAKREDPSTLAGVGLAVGIGEEILTLAERGGEIELRDTDGESKGRLAATALMDELARAIHRTGEPSVLFVDAIERANPVAHLGPLRATNPCGEQPLLPGESCVLGSLHLPAFASASGAIDWDRLARAVSDAVRFLDSVIDINRFPDADTADATLRTRKIGIGWMGFADLLLLRGWPYGHRACRELAREITSFLRRCACEASEKLAEERGPYPAWRGPAPARRNATLLAIAPTGTLRLIAGCSGGIEPFLRPVMSVRRAGESLLWIDRWLQDWAAKHAADPAALIEALRRERRNYALPGLEPEQAALLRRGWEIDPTDQIHVQAAFQSQVDGAVSKTVHLPEETHPQEIARLIRLAQRLGCKGVSFFRRGCTAAPPLDDESADIELPCAPCN